MAAGLYKDVAHRHRSIVLVDNGSFDRQAVVHVDLLMFLLFVVSTFFFSETKFLGLYIGSKF
jgi:hypothetical protein